MNQFKEVLLYQCLKCGSILKTEESCIKHKEKCVIEDENIVGQINLFENSIDKS